jgi:DNA-binding sugar fermentation-stimulating protein
LLNWEGDNAFIGECKIWTGAAKFREAIDQLLGYVTWRDTKAALIIFIKTGTPSDIIKKARAEVETHASDVRLKAEVDETRIDYLLQSPSDPERHIDLALIAVVIPQTGQ